MLNLKFTPMKSHFRPSDYTTEFKLKNIGPYYSSKVSFVSSKVMRLMHQICHPPVDYLREYWRMRNDE